MENHPIPASDPFLEARETAGVLETKFQGEKIPMILGYKDVRLAAGDWKTFSNDAPFRVPIPSEESMRSVRQLPIETDPPDHRDYRAIVDPFFRQPKESAMIARVENLIADMVRAASQQPMIEIVQEFALPLQSRALAYLLRVPDTEALEWIGWGTHVLRHGHGAVLEQYIHRQLDRATATPGDDFFSALVVAQFHGRSLTRDEMVGFANLTFAGGRDTIIQSVASLIGYLGTHPGALQRLRQEPDLIPTAVEELFRHLSPLTHIGRVCPVDTNVKGIEVKANERVSLCWASANRDASVFPDPDEMRLDRRPNPHLAFGVGPHNCIGAPHARLLIRTLLQQLCAQVEAVTVLGSEPNIEREADYERRVGYEVLRVTLSPRLKTS